MRGDSSRQDEVSIIKGDVLGRLRLTACDALADIAQVGDYRAHVLPKYLHAWRVRGSFKGCLWVARCVE